MERWIGEELPAGAERARKQGGEVWLGKEVGIRSDQHSGRMWVSRRGKMRFLRVRWRVAAEVFVEFLKRLLLDCRRPRRNSVPSSSWGTGESD